MIKSGQSARIIYVSVCKIYVDVHVVKSTTQNQNLSSACHDHLQPQRRQVWVVDPLRGRILACDNHEVVERLSRELHLHANALEHNTADRPRRLHNWSRTVFHLCREGKYLPCNSRLDTDLVDLVV